MARSEGFEPSTAWFVARYSIQLSYERATSLCTAYAITGVELSFHLNLLPK